MARQRRSPYDPAFDILPIDKDATRDRVMERLERVRLYRQFGDLRREASITASYELREGSSGGGVTKQTENIAVHNVDTEALNKQYSELLDRCMKRLRSIERKIIEECFLSDDPEFDFVIAGNIGVSDRTFQEYKSKALYNLAFAMRLEVLQEN